MALKPDIRFLKTIYISPVNVASAEIWKVAKLGWENLPRLRQVVAGEENIQVVAGGRIIRFDIEKCLGIGIGII